LTTFLYSFFSSSNELRFFRKVTVRFYSNFYSRMQLKSFVFLLSETDRHLGLSPLDRNQWLTHQEVLNSIVLVGNSNDQRGKVYTVNTELFFFFCLQNFPSCTDLMFIYCKSKTILSFLCYYQLIFSSCFSRN
jgi:hypothetical protein